MTANNGGGGGFNGFSLANVEMTTTPAGATVTKPTMMCYQSSYYSTYAEFQNILKGYNPANQSANGWLSGSASSPQWGTIDLAQPMPTVEMRLMGSGGVEGRSPKDFVIQGSNDNAAWTDVQSFSNMTQWVDWTWFVLNLSNGSCTSLLANGSN